MREETQAQKFWLIGFNDRLREAEHWHAALVQRQQKHSGLFFAQFLRKNPPGPEESAASRQVIEEATERRAQAEDALLQFIKDHPWPKETP